MSYVAILPFSRYRIMEAHATSHHVPNECFRMTLAAAFRALATSPFTFWIEFCLPSRTWVYATRSGSTTYPEHALIQRLHLV